MSKPAKEHLLEILKLSNEQLNELFDITEKLWNASEFVIEQTEKSWRTSIYISSAKKYEIKGVANLSDMVDSLTHSIEHLMSNSENDELNKEIIEEIPDTTKLNDLWKKIKNFNIIPELDYKIHNIANNIQLQDSHYDLKFFKTVHFGKKLPLVGFSFPLITEGQEKKISIEMTRTDINEFMSDLKTLIEELDKMYKEIE